jgi:ferritin-like metal-binding protein YciE
MTKINFLSDLLVEELADILSAENQLVEALPKMAEAGLSSALKSALEEFLAISREHVDRLEDIISKIGQSTNNLTSNVVKGYITEYEVVINNTERSSARDAAIIRVAQDVELYEIAEYKKAREHAADLGHTWIVEIFTKILNELRAMNFYFNELSQGMINIQAIKPSPKPKGGRSYLPKGKLRKKER